MLLQCMHKTAPYFFVTYVIKNVLEKNCAGWNGHANGNGHTNTSSANLHPQFFISHLFVWTKA